MNRNKVKPDPSFAFCLEKLGFTFTGKKFFEGGSIVSPDGQIVASYQQTSIDDNLQRFAFEMSRRSKASNQAIAGFAVGTAIAGGIGGGAAFLGGVALGGGSITTLGLEGAAEAANAAEAGSLIAQAASTVGNQGARAGSRAVAEQAARTGSARVQEKSWTDKPDTSLARSALTVLGSPGSQVRARRNPTLTSLTK